MRPRLPYVTWLAGSMADSATPAASRGTGCHSPTGHTSALALLPRRSGQERAADWPISRAAGHRLASTPHHRGQAHRSDWPALRGSRGSDPHRARLAGLYTGGFCLERVAAGHIALRPWRRYVWGGRRGQGRRLPSSPAGRSGPCQQYNPDRAAGRRLVRIRDARQSTWPWLPWRPGLSDGKLLRSG